MSSVHDIQGSAIGYDFWDGAGERPGRSIHDLAVDLEGSYAFQFGRVTVTADITGYGRASVGRSNIGGSVEYRLPLSEVPEAIVAVSDWLEGVGTPPPGDVRFVAQGGTWRGRLTEDFSTGTTVVDLGIGGRTPNLLLDIGVPNGSIFFGASFHEQYGAGGAFSFGYAPYRGDLGPVSFESGYNFSFGVYVEPDEPTHIPEANRSAADNNPDSPDGRYLSAISAGNNTAAAQAAAQGLSSTPDLNGVWHINYPDAVIRAAAGYGTPYPTYTHPAYNPAYSNGSDPTIGGFAPEDPRSQGPGNGGWEDDGGNFNDPSDYPGGTPSNGQNTNGGYNHSGSGTTTGTFEPSGGAMGRRQWQSGAWNA